MEISEAAKLKAVEIMNGGQADVFHVEGWLGLNVARYIQQVSDAAKKATGVLSIIGTSRTEQDAKDRLAPFILPDPVDPLKAAMDAAYEGKNFYRLEDADKARSAFADAVREELAKRGLQIVEAPDA